MQITILLTYEMSDSWCISVLQQLEPYQMAHSVFWCMASSGFWNKLAALHVLSFIFCYSTKDCHLKEDVREDPDYVLCMGKMHWKGRILSKHLTLSSFGGRFQPGVFPKARVPWQCHFCALSCSPETLPSLSHIHNGTEREEGDTTEEEGRLPD